MVHSIEFKFGLYITSYRRINPIDFGEYRMNSFFYRSTKKNSYTLGPKESNSLMCSSIQMLHPIELKFGMCIKDHRPTFCVEFRELRIKSFFTDLQKVFLYITAYRVKL